MEEAIILTYDTPADGFTRADEVSNDVKRKLKQMSVSPDAVREVAIAMYEGEIDMVIHAKGGVVTVEITTEKIKMILVNVGPGIPDVKLVIQAGYPTAPDEIRPLGSRAGMGLPNMKKYSDSMDTDTRIGEETIIIMAVNPQNAGMKG